MHLPSDGGGPASTSIPTSKTNAPIAPNLKNASELHDSSRSLSCLLSSCSPLFNLGVATFRGGGELASLSTWLSMCFFVLHRMQSCLCSSHIPELVKNLDTSYLCQALSQSRKGSGSFSGSAPWGRLLILPSDGRIVFLTHIAWLVWCTRLAIMRELFFSVRGRMQRLWSFLY